MAEPAAHRFLLQEGLWRCAGKRIPVGRFIVLGDAILSAWSIELSL